LENRLSGYFFSFFAPGEP